MKKRLLSALLAVCLMFGSAAALPEGYFGDVSQFSASAYDYKENDFEYTLLSDGTYELTKYRGSDATVSIPSTANGKAVTSIGSRVFYRLMKNTTLKTLTIPSSVKTVSQGAFDYCNALETVNVGSGVTSLPLNAFNDCPTLKAINVDKNNSTYSSINGIVYNKAQTQILIYPTGITNVTIPGSMEEVPSNVFEESKGMTTLTLESGVKTIPQDAFKKCTLLESVSLPNTLTTIGKEAFFGCTSLKTITIPKNVTSIGEKALGYYKDPNSIDVLKVSGFTIKGYKGSAAETYAKANGFTFEAIGESCSHTYGSPTWTWTQSSSTSYTASATFKCSKCGEVSAAQKASISTVQTSATCTTAEKYVYTAKVTFNSQTYSDTKTVTKGSALGHDWTDYKTTTEPTCTKDGVSTRSCKRTGCSTTETKSITKLGHDYSIKKVVAPTCKDQGYTLHSCTRCTDSYKDTYTDKTNDHKWSDWKTTKEPTETTEGTKERSCSVCGKKETDTIPKKSHTHNYTTKTVAPTCTAQGYVLHTCTGCGDTYKTNYKDPLGHSWTDWQTVEAATCTADGKKTRKCQRSGCNETETQIITKLGHKYSASVVAPTCTTAGYTLHKCTRCTDSYKDEHKDALGHDYVATVVKPTCTAKGYTLHKCSRCSDNYKDTYTDKVDHKWSDWKVTKKPTETTEGSKERSCSVCGKKETETIAKTTHKHTYTTKTVAPTCTSKGYTLHTCSGCGDTYEDNYKDPLGHSFGDWKTTTEPTCTADGTKTCTCKRSGCNAKKTKSVSKLGHSYTTKVVKPTCTAKGYTLYTCIRCGESYKENYTAATDHTWGTWKTTKAATEKTEGTKERSCTVCGKKQTATIPKKPHTHSYTTKTVKPTCEAKGYTLHVCKGCGDTYVDNYKSALGHTWGKWKTTKEATETSTGQKERYCSVCNKKETAVIPIKKHTHTYTTKTVAPTCTAKGYKLHTCKCGYSYKDNYKAALGHKWSSWKTTKAATCTASGTKTRTCSVCKKTETKTVAKLGHNYKATVVKPTCTAKGYTLHKCSRCSKSYKDTYKAALGHKWSSWKTTSFNLKNNTSVQQRKCSRCSKTSTRTISNAVTRLAGANRYETASIISSKMYTKADTVIIATGMTYHDALVAVPLASAYNAPLLLSTEKHITAQTETEIKRLKAKNIIVISTSGAIGTNAKAELKALKLNVTYIEGKTCFETAAKTAKALQTKTKKAPQTIFFATDSAYADALSVSPVAAIKNAPIIYLKNTGSLDKATASYLRSVKGSVKNAYIIGGDGVISNAMMKNVASALGLTVNKTVQRVWGNDRYATCVAVNKKFAKTLSGENLCVATGMDFPDALAGGVLAGNYKAPLLLVNGKLKTAKLTDEQIAYIKEKSSPRITVFGGVGAVSDDYIKLITG